MMYLAHAAARRRCHRETQISTLPTWPDLYATLSKSRSKGQLYTRDIGPYRRQPSSTVASSWPYRSSIAPDVIRNVLAEVCKINRSNADQLFDGLSNCMTALRSG